MQCQNPANGYSEETTGCLTAFRMRYWKSSLMLFKEKLFPKRESIISMV